MFKKLTLSAVGLLLLVSPLVSSAQTTSAVQAQIDALLKQITQLQAQIAALRGQSSAPAAGSSQCLDLNNNLVFDITDDTTNGEVSKLQRFLVSVGAYPEARITGYYGTLTAQAVMRWQKAHGMDFVTIKSGVGPMTRAKLREQCGGTTAAALKVIHPNGGENLPIGSTYTIQWSDTNPNTNHYIHTLNENGTEEIVTSTGRGGSYVWGVGEPKGGTLQPGRYKIRIYSTPYGCTLKAWIGVGEGDPNATPCANSVISYDDSDDWFTVRQAVTFTGSRVGSQDNLSWSSETNSMCALYAHKAGIYGDGLKLIVSNLPAVGNYAVSLPVSEAIRGYYTLQCAIGATVTESNIEKSIWVQENNI